MVPVVAVTAAVHTLVAFWATPIGHITVSERVGGKRGPTHLILNSWGGSSSGRPTTTQIRVIGVPLGGWSAQLTSAESCR